MVWVGGLVGWWWFDKLVFLHKPNNVGDCGIAPSFSLSTLSPKPMVQWKMEYSTIVEYSIFSLKDDY